MRTYIFTERERRIIKNFLAGKIPRNDRALSVITARVRTFLNLQGDVELYGALSKAIATAPA